jgi:hypothetical protein
MHVALMFHHGLREGAPNEVMSHPHVELLASTPHEQERLKLLAGQLAEFGTVPYSYKERPGSDPNSKSATLRIALCERDTQAKKK